MVAGRFSELERCCPLSEDLKEIIRKEQELPVFYGYRREKRFPVLFSVEKGSALFSTTWRENPASSEPSAVVKAEEGEFVLYLPGEPFIAKAEDEESIIVMHAPERI